MSNGHGPGSSPPRRHPHGHSRHQSYVAHPSSGRVRITGGLPHFAATPLDASDAPVAQSGADQPNQLAAGVYLADQHGTLQIQNLAAPAAKILLHPVLPIDASQVVRLSTSAGRPLQIQIDDWHQKGIVATLAAGQVQLQLNPMAGPHRRCC